MSIKKYEYENIVKISFQDYPKFWPDSGTYEYDMINVECLQETSRKDDFLVTAKMKPIYRTPLSELTLKNFQVTDTRV